MGGSDQWGNITTGSELIRRMGAGDAFAITSPLLTKADGSKFGKSEGGNIWLDPKRTSPYKFYQFWLNSSDEDAPRFIRIFSTRGQEELDALIAAHNADPGKHQLQKELAADITLRVHGEKELKGALAASQILFGNAGMEVLAALTEQQWRDLITAGMPIADLLAWENRLLPSKGEARRALKEGSIAVNRAKVGEDRVVGASDLLSGRFLLLQRGKKTYYLVKVV
jgi:tyrosyl-tRNA synthetase